jgi:hypothetical protein
MRNRFSSSEKKPSNNKETGTSAIRTNTTVIALNGFSGIEKCPKTHKQNDTAKTIDKRLYS